MKKEKLKKNGFTLTELLTTLIIIILLTGLTVGGVQTAMNAYYSVVDRANASTLLSTTLTELKKELGYATEITISDGKINYRSAKSGNQSVVYNSEDKEGIIVSESVNGVTAERLLVTMEAATKNLHCEFNEVTLAEGILTIKDIIVYKGTNEVIVRDEFMIRVE